MDNVLRAYMLYRETRLLSAQRERAGEERFVTS